jgi:hypothetical protein
MGLHRLTSSVCALTGSSARAASLSSAGWLRRLRAVGDHVRRGQEWPDAGAAGTPAEEQPDSRPPAGQAGLCGWPGRCWLGRRRAANARRLVVVRRDP